MTRIPGTLIAATTVLSIIAPAPAAGSVFAPGIAPPSLLHGAPTATASGAALAGTAYGGSAYYGSRLGYPRIGLLVRPDGRILARAAATVICRKQSYLPVYVRLAGKTQGAAFTASGRTRLDKLGTLRLTVKGTLDPQGATGTVRMRLPGCHGFTRHFLLRVASAPAGAPAMPAPSTILHGVTAQAAGGVRLPISLVVTHNGKVWAVWDATMGCHPGTYPMTNVTPITKIRPDGTFTRSERYSIRYQHGELDHFRVTLTGAFHADGATGTLVAHESTTQPGNRFRPCASGTQTWTATG